MNLYFSLKVIKEKKQKSKFSETTNIAPATMKIKQLKQITTLKCGYSSSQTAEFNPLLRAFRDHSTLQP